MQGLIKGVSVSCGCFQQEQLLKANTTHGMSKTPEFQVWAQMIDRCTNPNNRSFDHYGGRGIAVCDLWLNSFSNFIADMGRRPSPKHSLERRSNNGNYEPGNCYWATRLEQARNTSRTRKIVAQGEAKTLAEWAYFTGLPQEVIRGRLRRGWCAERALTEPQKGVVFKLLPDAAEGLKENVG
jgi:hypothetical protein